MTVQFSKYHGLGNDFLVVDLRAVPDEVRAQMQDPAVARALCDRQFGVGGDGVLAILAPRHGGDARMRVINADGSEAEMCGNGIRCVVRHLHERDPVLGDKALLVIETGAGPLTCAISKAQQELTVTVDMGRPRLTRGELPMLGPAEERCVEARLPIEQAALPYDGLFTCVSMGNPHAITFAPTGADLRQLAETVGPTLERGECFPRRTNVEFARLRSATELDLVVWERGCGITLACGTGACATVVAACLTGRSRPGDEVLVHLPGGELAITVAADLSTVSMRGPATFVFDATIDPAAVVRSARPS